MLFSNEFSDINTAIAKAAINLIFHFEAILTEVNACKSYTAGV